MTTLLLLALVGCGKEKDGDTAPEIDPTGTLTLHPENIPSVQVDGEEIPVTSWSPGDISTYEEICPDGVDGGYHYPSPSGGSELSTWPTGIWLFDEPWVTGATDGHFESFLHFDRPALSCSQWKTIYEYDYNDILNERQIHTLDPSSTDSLTLIDEQILAIRDELIAFYGSDIDIGGGYVGIDESRIWMSFYDYSGSQFNLVEIDLSTGSHEIIWTKEFSEPLSTSYMRTRDDQLFIEVRVQREHPSGTGYSVLDSIAVFNLADRSFVSLIDLPKTPEYYDESTVEGIPFADIEDRLVMNFSNLLVVGDELWIAHQASTEMDDDLLLQTSRATISRYDLETGEKIADVASDLYDLTSNDEIGSLAYMNDSGMVIIGGKKDLYVEDDLVYGAQTIQWLDSSGTVVTNQELSDADQYTSLKFSQDGSKLLEKYFVWSGGEAIIDKNYYAYDTESGQYLPTDSPEREIEVEPFVYSFEELPSEEIDVDAWALRSSLYDDDLMNGFDNGIRLYVGAARDYLYVDIDRKEAYYFQLSTDEPCYRFFLGYDPYDGEALYDYSCALETGAATVADGEVYAGYGFEVLRFKAPG